jgi:hypothetical protein
MSVKLLIRDHRPVVIGMRGCWRPPAAVMLAPPATLQNPTWYPTQEPAYGRSSGPSRCSWDSGVRGQRAAIPASSILRARPRALPGGLQLVAYQLSVR